MLGLAASIINPVEFYGFANNEAQLRQIAEDVLDLAAAKGADGAQVSLGESFGLNVDVRAGFPEQIDFSQQVSLDIVVYIGKRTGAASCSSLVRKDIEQSIERSIVIARQMHEDDCNGLPEVELLNLDNHMDLDVCHPWRPNVEEAVRIAAETAQASWETDKRINRTKSDGAGVSTSESRIVLANSLGFMAARDISSHMVSCGVIADLDHGMETAHWYDSKIAAPDLQDHLKIGAIAARRAVARAGRRKVSTCKVPVVFETGSAHSLIRTLCSAISGGSVYRKLSYLVDKVGEPVAADHLTVHENPFAQRRFGSTCYDAEGVRTTTRDVIKDGVLTTYLLDSYTARKLKLQSTGHAGGTHNLEVRCREATLEELLGQMERGLFVTDLVGKGGNIVTGDYSAGASGFWIEQGKIAYPVEEATIAGTLPQLLAGIVAGADDARTLGGLSCGSLLVEQLAVGGAT